MSWKLGAGLLKGQPDSSQAWVPRELDSAQGGEVEVPAVHPSSLASDLEFASHEAVSMGSFGAASENLSEMASGDTPEVPQVSASEAGAPPGKAILEKSGKHQGPYLYPRRQGQSSDGQIRQLVLFDCEVGRRRERDEGEEEMEMETGEEGGSSVVHFGPSGRKAVVPEVDLGLGKE